LITILEAAFEVPDHMTTAQRKLEALKKTNYNFSTYSAKF
jgi:hypothetical protein